MERSTTDGDHPSQTLQAAAIEDPDGVADADAEHPQKV
jgi:hypothetical protein